MQKGDSIHNYKIKKQIGKGGFGMVYLAKKNKKKYAIKEISIKNESYEKKFNKRNEFVINVKITRISWQTSRFPYFPGFSRISRMAAICT